MYQALRKFSLSLLIPMSLGLRGIFSTKLAQTLPDASSPDRLTTSYKRQNLQNDYLPLSVCLVVQRPYSKTSLMAEGGEVEFSRALTYPSACCKNKNH